MPILWVLFVLNLIGLVANFFVFFYGEPVALTSIAIGFSFIASVFIGGALLYGSRN